MEHLPDSTITDSFQIAQLDSNEKVLQMESLSISIRRVLLAFAPMWRVAVLDEIIQSPQLILAILQLLPCILVPDRNQRSFLQCKMLSELNRLLEVHISNVKTMTENYLVGTQLMNLLMSPPYLQFINDHITSTPKTALSTQVFRLFETVLTSSTAARFIWQYGRLHEPLHCGGMASNKGPLRAGFEIHFSVV